MAQTVVLGVIALALVVALSVIGVLEVVHNQPFNEPPSLAALAGVAVSQLFAHFLAQTAAATASLPGPVGAGQIATLTVSGPIGPTTGSGSANTPTFGAAAPPATGG